MAAARAVQCLLLAALLCAVTLLTASAAAPMTEPPYYGYVLYLRAETDRNLVAEVEAIVRPLLKRHRLVDVSSTEAWDGTRAASYSVRAADETPAALR
jgi:hypothetical protein